MRSWKWMSSPRESRRKEAGLSEDSREYKIKEAGKRRKAFRGDQEVFPLVPYTFLPLQFYVIAPVSNAVPCMQ